MKPGIRRAFFVATFLFIALNVACGGGGDADPPASDTPAASGGSTQVPTQPTSSASGGRIEQAGLVKEWDARAQPDPSKAYTTSFKTSDKEIDVLFKMKQAAEVTTAWKYQGKWVLLPGAITTQAVAGQWESFTFNWADGAQSFNAGDYEVTLSVIGTSETKTLKFSIDPVPNSARFSQAGMSKQWSSSVTPNPSTFATAFLPADQRINAVFQLTATGEVFATWKYGGDVIDFGEQPKIAPTSGGWGTQFLAASPFPIGEYEVTLALAGSSETRSLKFNVGTGTATKPRFEQAGLVAKQPAAGAAADSSTFVTTFKPTDQNVYAVFKLSAGDAWVWVTGTWKYQGAVIMETTDSGPVQAGTWARASFSLGSGLLAGDYELVLSMPGSSETKSLKFSVK